MNQRRFYLVQMLFGYEPLERPIWRAKQQGVAGTALPADFPAVAQLACIGYSTFDDLSEATPDELQRVGLSFTSVTAVFRALRTLQENGFLMGYTMVNGRWANTRDVTVAAVTAQAATFQSAAVEVGDQSVADLLLNVTAASGTTPSATCSIETSYDGSTNWTSVGAFAAATAVGSARKTFAGLSRFIRVNCTISGTTPSFNFTIAGETK